MIESKMHLSRVDHSEKMHYYNQMGMKSLFHQRTLSYLFYCMFNIDDAQQFQAIESFYLFKVIDIKYIQSLPV